jgi:phenylalanine-4-hydroxylase
MTSLPEGATPDWTIPQCWADYSAEEHAVWDTLFARQAAQLRGCATQAFLDGLKILNLEAPGIPDFEALSERLHRTTGWRVVAVPGLVPEAVFFDHLAHRRFVAGRFIRSLSALDYLKEPDVFHDVFGHVPLLAHPVFADYMQAYGEGGLRSVRFGALDRLARLYWYTVEFGLIEEPDGLRLYGAGIVSSHSESDFALKSDSPHRLGFDLMRVMRTPYRIDDYQQTYFVVRSFEDLLAQTLDTDFAPLYAALGRLPDFEIDGIGPEDRVITRGTQAYAKAQKRA